MSGVRPSTISRIEAGATAPSVDTVNQILASVGYRLEVVDQDDEPLDLDPERFAYWDKAGRRFPAHLQPFRTPTRWDQGVRDDVGRWWGWGHIAFDYFGDPNAPEYTFSRRQTPMGCQTVLVSVKKPSREMPGSCSQSVGPGT